VLEAGMKKRLSKDPRRRKFLKDLAAGALVFALPPGTALSETGMPPKKPRVGIQLWTLRQEIETDPRGTLKRIVEIGFAGVETAFFSGEFSLKKASQLLK
jgi:hypothetical protein